MSRNSGRNSGAVVAHLDLDRVAEILRRHPQYRTEAVARLAATFGRGIKAVAKQVEEHPRDVLRHQLDRRDGAIEIALQSDVEPLILSAGTVIGEVKCLLDHRIDIDALPLADAAARMCQHARDDAIGPLAVLGDLFEIAGQHSDDLVDLGALVLVERRHGRRHRFLQFVEQFDREAGEIVDEVERVLDLVRNPGSRSAGTIRSLTSPMGSPRRATPSSNLWHRLRWRFASVAHRDFFVEDPEHYAPQYDGYCAMGVGGDAAADAHKDTVDPEAWAIVDGKLYLTHNQYWLQEWHKNAADNIRQADRNWEAVREPPAPEIVGPPCAASPLSTKVALRGGGHWVIVAGQVARDGDGKVVGKGDLKAQIEQVGKNVGACLAAGGATVKDILFTVSHVTQPAEFDKYADLRMRYFGPPAAAFHCSRSGVPTWPTPIS